MKQLVLQTLCAAALSCVTGMAFADDWKDESGKGRDNNRLFEDGEWKPSGDDKGRRRGSYFHEHGYTRLQIPPGHYPPPGECRVWYPDRPPGQQPPRGQCRSVPPDAWLIRHPRDLPGHVHVTVYEPRRPGVVLIVGEFEIASGALVRIVLQN